MRCGEFENSLQRFFVEIGEILDAGAFVDDYSTIALEAPEMPESFIQQSFVHVGESTTQKNLASSLTAVMEMEKVLYHANAWAEDGASIHIFSKQRASQVRNERTRHSTPFGEKPKLAEYLVML